MADVTRNAPVGVILAAGSGLRLARDSKPLARVAGVTLLERAVWALRRAGVERVVAVVGHRGDEVRRFVAERALPVELVENPDYMRGNGSSALVGGRAAGGRFVLMMVDHVVEPDAIARLLGREEPFVAAVDTAPAYCDRGEATKVRLVGDHVVAVSRSLDGYEAVDAGLFACRPVVLAAAERALEEGAASWNDVKRRYLGAGGAITAVDLRGAFWLDVDTPGDLRRAERVLVRRAAAKPSDGVVSRRLNRPLSRSLSLLLVRTRISPNAISALTFLITLGAAGLLALGRMNALVLVAAGVFVQLCSIVEGVDGEVARASLRASPRGGFLDSVLDRVGDAALLIGLAVAAGPGTATWSALVAALFGSLVVPYVKASYEAAFDRPMPPGAGGSFGRDTRMLVVALAAVSLQPFAGLVAVAAVSYIEGARRFAAGWRSGAIAARTGAPAPQPTAASAASPRSRPGSAKLAEHQRD
jgi:1L-myo-inositol 1-phosphate cytidylyltransferase / CDP-L-myo-inositol myo-inositolphosphotransferase